MSPENSAERWPYVALADVIETIRGGVSVLCDDGVCDEANPGVLTLSAVTYGEFRPAECKRALPEQIERLSVPVRGGTILITRKNTPELVGKVALVREDYPSLYLPDLIWEISPRAGVDVRWLHAYLASPSFRNVVEQGAAGSSQSMVGISRDVVLTAQAPLPSLQEQRRIAAVLDRWDKAIAVAQRLIAAKCKRFDWMRDMVLTGHVRLSGFEDAWRRVRLSEVLHEHAATSTGAEPVYSVSVHRGLVDQVEHLGRSFAAASTSHYNRVKPGDIVYTKSPTGSFPLGIIKQSKAEREVIVSPLYGVFTPETRALGILLDAYFSSAANALRYLSPIVQKGAKNTIAVTNNQFLQGELNLPVDSQEVDALAGLIGSTLDDISASEAEVALLRRQKRGLMQKLLTGEWRAPVLGDAFAPGGSAADRLEAVE